jgi:hypothetical protein
MVPEGLVRKSKLPKHAYEGHKVGCNEARMLEIGINSRYTESAYMACLTNLISQPSLKISPI